MKAGLLRCFTDEFSFRLPVRIARMEGPVCGVMTEERRKGRDCGADLVGACHQEQSSQAGILENRRLLCFHLALSRPLMQKMQRSWMQVIVCRGAQSNWRTLPVRAQFFCSLRVRQAGLKFVI